MSDETDPNRPETVLAHAAWLRALARRLVGDADVAEDLAQDSWLSAVEHPPRRSVRGWLAVVVRHAARALRLRERARERREALARRPEPVPDPAVLAERLELQRRLVTMVQALEEPYRTAIQLRYLEGLEPAEIAARTGEPAATVRSRIHRGLAKLRERLDREAGGRAAWALVHLPPGRGAAGVTGGAAAGAVAGGLIVSVKTKIAVVVAVLVLLAVAGWRASRSPEAPAPETPRERAVAEATPAPEREHTGPVPPPDAPASSADLPVGSPPPPTAEEEAPPPLPLGTVLGRVTLPDGSRPVGVTVRLTRFTEREDDARLRGVIRSVEADTEGRFRLDGLPPGTYWLEASHADFARHGVRVVLPEDRSAGPINVALSAGGTIAVRVVGSSGEPLGGELLMLLEEGASYRMETTDAEGSARFERVEAGTYTVEWSRNLSKVSQVAIVGRGGTAELTFRPGATLRGTVRLADGSAPEARRAVVNLTPVPVKATRYSDHVGEGGSFVLHDVEPGEYAITVQVFDLSGMADLGRITVEGGETMELALRVPPTLLEGRVSRKDGKPVRPLEAGLWLTRVRIADGRIVEREPGLYGLTDEEGRFRYPGVRPGTYEVVVMPRRDRSLGVQRRIVEVPPDGRLDGVDFVLEREPRGTLRATVLEADGSPATGVTLLEIRREGDRESSGAVRVEERGPGLLDVTLRPGRRVVKASRVETSPRGLVVDTVVVDIDEGAVVETTMRLLPTGVLRLRVREADGSEAEGFAFAVADEGRAEIPVAAIRREDGAWGLLLREGSRLVRIRRDGDVVGEVRAGVPAGGAVEAAVTVR